MEGITIESLHLNIGDELLIDIPDFFYRFIKKGKNNIFKTGYNEKAENGWIHCPVIKGYYCGYRNYNDSGELEMIKIRISDPIKMLNKYHNYIVFSPSVINSIEVLKKGEGNILDKISHVLNTEKSQGKAASA
ncbi:MAG: hypothetical protein QQN41_06050 [Nitrosopumilus sp.]